ncbi:MAG: AAA family ATPase [bacterium]|nr:AAA family ATPase [bacterium]
MKTQLSAVDERLASSRLPASALRWICDPSQFAFESTAEVPAHQGLPGQARAEAAIEFGVGIRRDGYNLYVMGPSGAGKRTVMLGYLEQVAVTEQVPNDLCYVNNFRDEDRPCALQLPAGKGRQLVKDVEQLLDDLQLAIPAALEATEHRQRIGQLEQEFQDEHAKSLEKVAEEARTKGLEMIRTPTGIALAPVREGKVIAPEDFEKLNAEQKKSIESAIEEVQPKLVAIVQELPQLERLARQKIRELNQRVTLHVVEQLIFPLIGQWQELPSVVSHLQALQEDVIENADAFLPPPEGTPALLFAENRKSSFDPYLVNLLVDNSETKGAPVVFEDYPYIHNLVGRVEHETHMGSLVTHFSLIKAGALHRANGGYLILQARDVLMQPFCWEALKRALQCAQIQIESINAAVSLISTVSLQPEPVSLDVKVVLLGGRELYYLLQEYDPEFSELFKVAVDFSDETDCDGEHCQLFAGLLASLAAKENTRPMDRSAVALMIEQAARQAGDQQKLSTHMRTISDLLRESDYWASVQNSDLISGSHVRQAIEQQVYRSDRIRERIHDEIRRGTLLVDTRGEKAGQINGLSVSSLGSFAFGRPSRITATARMGRGKVVDIEREVELGGALHSKGVLILSSLLASRYARDYPLALTASLVFEQSYGLVDGDSASVAEFCALLSALSKIPIRQSLAITGSLNQLGEAQPIGGVNEKVEGFFDVCKATGLTGEQGVLIPKSNAKHLMLRQDVILAVDEGKFAVFTYENVDEAMELLTGMEAGQASIDGNYLPNTINAKVEQRLREFAQLSREFAAPPEHAAKGDGSNG